MEYDSRKYIIEMPEKRRVMSLSYKHFPIASSGSDDSFQSQAGPSNHPRCADVEQEPQELENLTSAGKRQSPQIPRVPVPTESFRNRGIAPEHHLEAAPEYESHSGGNPIPQGNTRDQGLIPPEHHLDTAPEYESDAGGNSRNYRSEAAPDYESDTGGNDFDKHLPPIPLLRPIWKRRKCGRSIRCWIIVALGILLLAIIVGAVLGVKLRHNRNFSDDGESFIVNQPNQNLTLNCPSINGQVASFNSSSSIQGSITSTSTSTPFQFKQFCNKATIVASPNMTQIPSTTIQNSEYEYIQNPSITTTLRACIQRCSSYNIGQQSEISSGKVNPCFGAWFDANQIWSSEAESYDSNCYLYSMSKGNFTETDVLGASGGRTAMAVMVSWNNDSFVGSYLSGNGDWKGGVNTTGPFL